VRKSEVARGRPKSRANPNGSECAERKENGKRDVKDTSKLFCFLYKKSIILVMRCGVLDCETDG